MASKLSLSVKRNLDWETKLPSYRTAYRYESPVFVYMKVRWKIVFGLSTLDGERYYIVLINCDGTHHFTAFSVSTHLQFKSTGVQQQCSNSTVSHSFAFLYFAKRDVVDKAFNISLYTTNFDVTLTCIFRPSTNLIVDIIGIKADASTQVSDEFLDSQNKLKTAEDFAKDPSTSSLVSFPHFESLSEDFSYMLQKGILTDIELKSGEVSIPTHKAVLASRSKIFSSMFEHEMMESITNSVDIEDIEPSTLQEFLKYLYSGKVSADFPVKLIVELYKAGDKYAVLSLQQGCSDMLVRNLSEENCIEFLTLAEKHCDEKLRDTIAGFIIERPEVLKSDVWFEFSDNFCKLANSIYKKYVAKTT